MERTDGDNGENKKKYGRKEWMDRDNREKKKKYLWKGRMGIMEKIKRNIDEKMDGDNRENKKKY